MCISGHVWLLIIRDNEKGNDVDGWVTESIMALTIECEHDFVKVLSWDNVTFQCTVEYVRKYTAETST